MPALLLVAHCAHDAGGDTTPSETPDSGRADDGPAVDAGQGDDQGNVSLPDVRAGWWRTAVFYEIFVRSFRDSDGDGVGDLAGLTSQLDYLNDGDPLTRTDLGVDALWLMPIQTSPSYHGYDVTDYKAINPDYGDLADFDRLLQQAHRRGIKVIIDFVLNHSSSQHPWFRQARAPGSAQRDFYIWRDAPDTRWRRPWDGANVWHSSANGYYFGIFWSGMPDLNLEHPEVDANMLDAMRFWLDRGVDGFRVDAVRYLLQTDDGQLADIPATHAYVQGLRRRTADFPEAVWVAEAWTDTAKVAQYYGREGDEFQLAFSFDVAGAIKSSINDGNRATLNQALAEAGRAFADRGFEAPFLSNHDMARVMRELGADAGKMRVAAATLMAMPGTPFVYYGEEIGMRGGASNRDEDKRTPMHWTDEGPGYGFTTADRTWHPSPEAVGVSVAAQRNQAGSLWTLYRDLIQLRHQRSALAEGTATLPAVIDGDRGVFALLRSAGEDRLLFVANFNGAAAAAFTVDVAGSPAVALHEGAGAVMSAEDRVVVEGLAPRGFAFIRLD